MDQVFPKSRVGSWNPKNYPTVKKCEIVKKRESSGEVWGIPQFHPISGNIGKNPGMNLERISNFDAFNLSFNNSVCSCC